MTLKLKQLRRGMRFSFIPASWHGPSVVRESYKSGDCWCVIYDNANVVNPPGRVYGDPDERVRILKKVSGRGQS